MNVRNGSMAGSQLEEILGIWREAIGQKRLQADVETGLLVTVLFDIRLTILRIGQLVARHAARVGIPAGVIFFKVSKSCSTVE